ncbi:hypothetical protein ADK70_17825 [Streptomyces rimosus subsp. pseudoverticillatus]|uniref:hypothetical protein n=1 Tax=Streptomyces rimosus TaxID=1927 RepID=UPI0006BFF0CF|nr:hypothetical protein [Streptomyces rimosus]KOT90134.1 hypothetical protein ADK70_17825 [Streptomyces rimosus subsp. pseudoverticillatus]
MSSTRTRTTRRIALAVSVLALAPIASATATPVPAEPTSRLAGTAMPAARSGSPQSVVDRVAHFYGAYVDARYDGRPGPLPGSLRQHYLTRNALKRLTVWEKTHHLDGVLRAKGTPVTWHVTYQDSAMGHCWSRVRLTWGPLQHRHHSYLSVQSDLSTRLISDIKTTK